MYRPTHLFKKGIFPFVEGAANFFLSVNTFVGSFRLFFIVFIMKTFPLLEILFYILRIMKKIKYNILHWNSAVFFYNILTQMLFRRKFELSPDVKIDQEISLARIVYK